MTESRSCVLVLLTVSSIATAGAADVDQAERALETCKRSMTRTYEVAIEASVSDGADQYKEYAGLQFGVTGPSMRAYVRHAVGAPVMLEDVQFRDASGKAMRLSSDALALARSDLYVRDEQGMETFCLVTPFSGLGSSGSFQAHVVLTAIEVQGGRAAKPVGEIIRRR